MRIFAKIKTSTRKIHKVIEPNYPSVHIKAWTNGLEIEEKAYSQVIGISKLGIIHNHIALMPDVHYGIGATVGSVIPTIGAIIPSAVGVDIGCGMQAIKTDLKAKDLPDSLKSLRDKIEKEIPLGMKGWDNVPKFVGSLWDRHLEKEFQILTSKYPTFEKSNNVNHLGTLGTGNHFIEICLDETDTIWLMLHSGSRGIGNKIGRTFIELAKKDMKKHLRNLPDEDLAYFRESSEYFDDYVFAVNWAQKYAQINRQAMMNHLISIIKSNLKLNFNVNEMVVDCHHNYVQKEFHFGKEVYLTRKGAVSAEKGKYGIIPGSMGERSFIVRGKGNPDSFNSCSHGAGRIMSRGEAKLKFTIQDHEISTKGVECRKDSHILDETPKAYKDIDKVMKAQEDLIEIVYTLKQILCVKG